MPLCVKNILDLIEDKKQENISEKKKEKKIFRVNKVWPGELWST